MYVEYRDNERAMKKLFKRYGERGIMTKCKTKDMDLVTSKIMKVITVVSFVMCIVIEFFPGIYSRYEIFQQHKDFFENFFWGVLGSAFITYVMSHLVFKQRKKEKENDIEKYINVVGKKYWNLFLINDVSINEYKIRSDELQKAVGELIDHCDESYIYVKECKQLIQMCRDILIPLCKEVKVFSETLESKRSIIQISENSDQNVEDQVLKEIYENFKDYLNKKFVLKEINQRFYGVSMIYGEIMDQIEKDNKEFLDLSRRIKLETEYHKMIDEVVKRP